MRILTTAFCLTASAVLMVQAPLLAELGGPGPGGGGGFGGGGFHGGSIGNAGHVNNYPYYGGGCCYGYAMGSTTVQGDENLNPGQNPASPVAGTGTGGGPPEKIQDGTGVYVSQGQVLDDGEAGFDNDWWGNDPRTESQKAADAAVKAGTGSTVPSLPRNYDTLYDPSGRYYLSQGTFFQSAESGGYQVVAPPIGIEVKQVPRNAEMVTVGNQQYFVYNDIYYQALYSGSGIIYKVVEDPGA